MTNPAQVTLINAFEVPSTADEQFTAAWRRARDLLSRQPGYGGTLLHRALGADVRFRFVNIAYWQTPEEFRAATEAAAIRSETFPFPAHPGLYEVASADERVTTELAGDSVTLINFFVVSPTEGGFISGWEQARGFLSRQPGYLDTALHHSTQPDVDFGFVNIAHWTSAEAFTSAIRDPAFRAAASMAYQSYPALYRLVAE